MIYTDCIGHLISDLSYEELHTFAKSIGLKREWFQPDGKKHHRNMNTPKHYDLTTPEMKKKAINKGAVFIDSRALVKIMIELERKEEST